MVFGSVWLDIIVVVICGLIGGFGLGVLHESGIELPHGRATVDKKDKDTKPLIRFYDFGFVSDMLVGALAAVVLYAMNQPAGQLQLITLGITAGLGGAGILKGFAQKQTIQALADAGLVAIGEAKSANVGGAKPSPNGEEARKSSAKEEQPFPANELIGKGPRPYIASVAKTAIASSMPKEVLAEGDSKLELLEEKINRLAKLN